ncbi:MAG: PAS domain S-box protein [Gemmatimonadaceae bacterium]
MVRPLLAATLSDRSLEALLMAAVVALGLAIAHGWRRSRQIRALARATRELDAPGVWVAPASLSNDLADLGDAIQELHRAFSSRTGVLRATTDAHEAAEAELRKELGRVREEMAANRDAVDERLELAITSAPSGMLLINEAGIITFANPESERLFGYEKGELAGRPVDLLVPPNRRDGHDRLRAAFAHAPTKRMMGAGRELFGVRKDGSRIPVEVGLTPIRSQQEFVVLAVVIDISERRAAEERFQLAVEASPSGMVMLDASGTILLVNKETERLFDYRREDLIGQPIEILVPDAMRAGHAGLRAEFYAEPKRRAMGTGRDLYGRRRDGSEVPLEIGLNPIATADGIFVLASVVDISQRKMFEHELRRSNAELEQFAYVASHDLQEPLRAVASFTELLEQRYKDQLDEKARTYIHHAADGARRMQRLIRDLLKVSRVGQGQVPLAPTDTATVLRDVLETRLRDAIRDAGAIVQVGALPVVSANETLFGQLIQNLLSNALKFRSADRAPVIHLSAERMGSTWRFAVSDNGIGIAPEHSERVFQLFQRLHSVAEYPGSGIGLALARRIVERHHGRIWFESRPGEGTTFYFTLPADRP